MSPAHSPPMDNETPEIDYLSRDYESFRRLMLDHMAQWVPDWVEDNPSGLEHALIDALAYLADYASYYQDAVATEAYLGTARRRRSVRRHARLLDYVLHEGCNARVWVQVEVGGDVPKGVTLGKGTQLLARVDGVDEVTIEPGSDLYHRLLSQQSPPCVFETMHDARLFPWLNCLPFYRSNQDDPYLPAGSTRAALRWDGSRPAPRPGAVLIFEERLNPRDGFSQIPDPAHRHAVRLTDCRLEKAGEQDILQVEWAVADALPFDLYIARHHGQDVSLARGNIILADHGRTIHDEALPVVRPGERYRPGLRLTGLTHGTPFDPHQARRQPASQTIGQDPRAALPDIRLVERGAEIDLKADGRPLLPVNEEETRTAVCQRAWRLRRELLDSGPGSCDFMCEIDNRGRAFLRFGFGGMGRSPVAGHRFYASYRIGNGIVGNIGPDVLAHIVTSHPHVGGVRNLLPARGGQEREPIESARLLAPYAHWDQERCVTQQDYEARAESHPEVARAVARLQWTGSWHTAYIYVQRRNGNKVDDAFKQELCRFMNRYRLAGYDIEIHAPHYVPVHITLDVTVGPGHHASTVEQALWYAFSSQRLSETSVGFFHPSRFTFAQPVYRSQVIRAALAVPGANRIQVLRFGRGQEDSQVYQDKIPIQTLEIAQCRNDPRDPSSGTIKFIMEGGL
jgi:hypothetical protein